jgi:hypothetical protein
MDGVIVNSIARRMPGHYELVTVHLSRFIYLSSSVFNSCVRGVALSVISAPVSMRALQRDHADPI